MAQIQWISVFAQDASDRLVTSRGTSLEMLGEHLIAAAIFSVVGVIIFFASLFLMEKLTPFSIIKEIGEEQNVAVSVLVGAIVLGISIIIGASILG